MKHLHTYFIGWVMMQVTLIVVLVTSIRSSRELTTNKGKLAVWRDANPCKKTQVGWSRVQILLTAKFFSCKKYFFDHVDVQF